MKEKCYWAEDSDGNWETDCGNMFTLISGTPIENDFQYCPYCGKEIQERQYTSTINYG